MVETGLLSAGPCHQPKLKKTRKNGSEHHDAFDEFLQIYMNDESENMKK